MKSDRLLHLLSRYRNTVELLENFKAAYFYHGAPVIVDCKRYKGPGVVVTDGNCWSDHVAVALPNGNTWRYPLESVRIDTQIKTKQI